MYEILTGKEFKEAVKQIPIKSAICKYSKEKYEIWEVSDEDFNELDSYIDKYDYFEEGQNPKVWKDEWGWWRWSSGSNIQSDYTCFMEINGRLMKMYFNSYCYDEYISDGLNELSIRKSILTEEELCEAKNELTQRFFYNKCNYKNFLEYCNDQYHVSTEKNICAISVECAKLNKMSLAEFWNLTV